MNICWMCMNGFNQGAETCIDCGRTATPMEGWITWFFVGILLLATVIAWSLPRVTNLHPTQVEHGVLIGVFPFLMFILWKLR